MALFGSKYYADFIFILSLAFWEGFVKPLMFFLLLIIYLLGMAAGEVYLMLLQVTSWHLRKSFCK